MPPVPPARRQVAAVVARKPPSAKQLRFWYLLSSHPDHPSQGLGQDRFDALPQPCRTALVAVTTTMPWLDPVSLAALEAYYASGYKPASSPSYVAWWEEDLRRAVRIMQAPDEDISTFLSMFPALSDSFVVSKLLSFLTTPELKAGEKIRLEALRFIAELKGWRTGDQAAAVQASQIVIHTSQEPTVKPQHEPQRIDIEL